MRHIPLSYADMLLIEEIYRPLRDLHVEYEINAQEENWASSYRYLKDSSWPDCVSFDSFNLLPTHIKDECINVHRFSPEIFKQSIIDDVDAAYTVNTQWALTEEMCVLFEKHSEIFRGKKVADLACNFGYWSVFSCAQDCDNVIATDVREKSIKVATSIRDSLSISETKLKTIVGDLHNYSFVKDVCSDRDTVLLLGIMYHVHDHYAILKNACQSNVKHVVIETGERQEIAESKQPLIWWRLEPTFSPLSGFMDSYNHVLVGYPNSSWFDMVMHELGFVRKDFTSFVTNASQQNIETFKSNRSMYLYERI